MADEKRPTREQREEELNAKEALELRKMWGRYYAPPEGGKYFPQKREELIEDLLNYEEKRGDFEGEES